MLIGGRRKVLNKQCEKEEYTTHQSAFNAAREIGKRDKISMYVYKCEHGDHWHLATHGKKKFIKNIKHPSSINAKIKFTPPSKKFARNEKQQSLDYATEKMISPNMARMLKGLIEAKNRLNKK